MDRQHAKSQATGCLFFKVSYVQDILNEPHTRCSLSLSLVSLYSLLPIPMPICLSDRTCISCGMSNVLYIPARNRQRILLDSLQISVCKPTSNQIALFPETRAFDAARLGSGRIKAHAGMQGPATHHQPRRLVGAAPPRGPSARAAATTHPISAQDGTHIYVGTRTLMLVQLPCGSWGAIFGLQDTRMAPQRTGALDSCTCDTHLEK